MAIFAATELDRFAADVLKSRGVSSVFADQTAAETTETQKEDTVIGKVDNVAVPRVA